ncbi:MAG: ATP-dependent Clp protease ATP-binding subunit [Candidatus Uhrbacteria bacterium]
MQDIVEKFTTHLKNVLTRALSFAAETDQDEILPEHLLWALGMQKGCVGAEIVQKTKIDLENLRKLIETVDTGKRPMSKQPITATIPVLSSEAKRAIEKAVLTANIYQHQYVGTEHLLSGLLQVKHKTIEEFLTDQKIDLKKLHDQIALVLKGASKFPEFTETLDNLDDDLEMTMTVDEQPSSIFDSENQKTPALDYFARDLTSEEIQAGIDPVIARDQEILRVMEILSRRTKNNPILLGEPGVGKTAIVEGLAKKILADQVPPVLQGKRIMALDMSLVVAGTMYRGEFEERLRQVIEEVRNNQNIILFIDEVHTIIGAGASTGNLDAANILKPALARGEIRCIGATTTAEFKKHIETDAALERRFQSVFVDEPTPEDTLLILKGIAVNYERFHSVYISAEALEAAVDFSVQYMPGKFLPDKAIDLVDEAAAAYRVANANATSTKELISLERELKQVRQEKRQAIIEERFKDAVEIKEKEDIILAKARQVREQEEEPEMSGSLGRKDVARIVSRMSGVPVDDLLNQSGKELLDLEKILSQHILGQDPAIKLVADAIRRAKTGTNHPERPLASFLFVGPSGVGKTELACVLAREVYQNKDALIRLDMSEYSESFTVSKLIGAPAGYVGYREGAKLTDRIKQRPYSVVLFDEFEKAHSDVQNLLLQILENGEITDATGKKINFRNAIIIITSNVGLERITHGQLGFAGSAEEHQSLSLDDLRTDLEERFRPELLNRIDSICLFQPLNKNTLKAIAELQLNQLAKRLDTKNVKIVYNDKVTDFLVKQTDQSSIGARAIRQLISSDVETAIADRRLKRPQVKLLKIMIIKNKIAVQTFQK